jgi:hypothetical protein
VQRSGTCWRCAQLGMVLITLVKFGWNPTSSLTCEGRTSLMRTDGRSYQSYIMGLSFVISFVLFNPTMQKITPQEKRNEWHFEGHKYQSSKPCTFRQVDFLSFYYMYIMNINDHQGQPSFDPRGIISTILVQVYYTKFHAKYLTSSLCQFRGDYLDFSYIHIRKIYDPWGLGQFWH